MIVSGLMIERILYSYIKDSKLLKGVDRVNGNVYRGENRPDASTAEDIVVSFLTGYDEQFQTGVCIVNIYVNDIIAGKNARKVANTNRLEKFATILNSVLYNVYYEGINFYIQDTPTIGDAEELEQHYVTARVRYNRFTETN